MEVLVYVDADAHDPILWHVADQLHVRLAATALHMLPFLATHLGISFRLWVEEIPYHNS
jgi:hypothetical protein